MIDRRSLLRVGPAALAVGTLPATAAAARTVSAETTTGISAIPAFPRPARPRARVLIVNDLAGDVDGLFATVHALLSSSTDIRGIVGAGTGNMAFTATETAVDATKRAREIVRLLGLGDRIRVFEGAARPLSDPVAPVRSPGVQAIIDEASRTDTDVPLYVTVGCGLTEVASALLIEPRIARRFTLIWIGGEPLPNGRSTRPGLANGGEYNFSIDRLAAQSVFNASEVPIWQVPSPAYAACTVSLDELRMNVAPRGAIGRWLWERLCEAQTVLTAHGMPIGDTYTLGDNPLVALTALTNWPPTAMSPARFEQTGSSPYREIYAPILNADGTYGARSAGRRIRAYDSIDTRLMFADLFAKLARAYPG